MFLKVKSCTYIITYQNGYLANIKLSINLHLDDDWNNPNDQPFISNNKINLMIKINN